MPRVSWLIGILFLAVPCAAQEKFSIEEKASKPPRAVDARIAKLLSAKSIQFANGGGKEVAEVWFRARIPTDASPEQIKNGITYREVKQGEILGVARFEKERTDYRMQRIPAGVYTMRLGYQPEDGDHMGMGEFQEYVLLINAEKDDSAEPMDAETMVKLSMKTIKTGHPAILMLVPTPAKGKETELVSRPRGEWVVAVRREIVANGKKTGANFGIGLTLEGHAVE